MISPSLKNACPYLLSLNSKTGKAKQNKKTHTQSSEILIRIQKHPSPNEVQVTMSSIKSEMNAYTNQQKSLTYNEEKNDAWRLTHN